MTLSSKPSSEKRLPARQGAPNLAATRAGVLARFAQVAFGFVLELAVLLIGSGRLDWIWAWVFLGINILSVMVIGTLLLRTSPETVAERGRARFSRGWDKLVSALWTFMQYLFLPLVAALDIRFLWTHGFDLGWHLAGSVLFAAGLGLFGWAMIVNAYFSTAVRIQTDRGQTVCRSGPYRFVRHPGYLGVVLQSLAVPFLLGSWWALIPGIASALLILIRTYLEDHTLQMELPGYSDYVGDVRFRIIPGIW